MTLAADLCVSPWTSKFGLALVLPQQEREAGGGQLCRGFRRTLLAESEARNGKPNRHKNKSEQENNCNPETVPLLLCRAALTNTLKSTPGVAASVRMSNNGTENLQHRLEGNDCPSALQHGKPFKMLKPNKEQQKH